MEEHPNIVSSVNMHSYGNAWIYPFNYLKDPSDNLLRKKNRLFFDFLRKLEKKIKEKDQNAIFGNASRTLDYASNGEAGDWFTGAKNILNLDVELGNHDISSNKFYPPKILIDKIVRYNWIIMKEFLTSHTLNFSLKKLIIHPMYKSYTFLIQNESLSSLKDGMITISLNHKT